MLFIFKAFLTPFNSGCKQYIPVLEMETLPCPTLSKNIPHLTQSRFRELNLAKTKPNTHKSSDLFFSCLHLPTKEFQLFQPTTHPVISARSEKPGSEEPGNTDDGTPPAHQVMPQPPIQLQFQYKRALNFSLVQSVSSAQENILQDCHTSTH